MGAKRIAISIKSMKMILVSHSKLQQQSGKNALTNYKTNQQDLSIDEKTNKHVGFLVDA